MFMPPEHQVVERNSGWWWRCCYGCHGCSGWYFGPFNTQAEATEARKEWRFKPRAATAEPGK